MTVASGPTPRLLTAGQLFLDLVFADLASAPRLGEEHSESYADSAEAAYVGRFSAAVDELGVAYGRPQETGHRPGLRCLDLGPLHLRAVAAGTTGLPGFQLDRHTAQERTGVAHAHELPPSSGLWLYLDAAQHGLGSRACGPDVLPRYALWPRAVSWTVVFDEIGPRRQN